jgi:integrase
MPRRRKPARLYLRRGRDDRSSVWVILDGSRETSTAAGIDERPKAEAALREYLAQNHQPPCGANRLDQLLVSEVMNVYLTEHAPTRTSAKWIGDMAGDIITWWADKTLADINGRTCRAYVEWRTTQPIARFKNSKGPLVGDQTARNELSVLRAALGHWHREYGPLTAVPVVTMPPKKPPRTNYFLTRDEIANRLRVARRRPETRHTARMLLLGFYSGGRPGALLQLRWLPSPTAGWVDLGKGVIHRRGTQAVRTNKRQPPVRVHARLMPHLRRWQQADMAIGISHVIHHMGKPVQSVAKAWGSVRKRAGTHEKDTPHVLRHSSATNFMQLGVPVAEIAGFLGMSVDVLMSTYAHHHPDFQSGIAQATPRKQANRSGTR